MRKRRRSSAFFAATTVRKTTRKPSEYRENLKMRKIRARRSTRNTAAPDAPGDCVFEPRTVHFNVPGIGKDGEPATWLDVRKESTIPDGCTKRCTYLARGRGYFHVPDRAGVREDIVLGFDDLEGYRERSQYFGCSVGRVGNRIANGRFTLDGETFQLPRNNGPHHLHGGERGLDKVI